MLSPQLYKSKTVHVGTETIKKGLRYEKKVLGHLKLLYGDLFSCQVRLATGIADGILQAEDFLGIVEVKSTYTADCWFQLQRYAKCFSKDVSRIAVVRAYDPKVRLPELPVLLPSLEGLCGLEPGFFVIPFSGRFV